MYETFNMVQWPYLVCFNDLLPLFAGTGKWLYFYSAPALYPISGVFTRFIVEKIGIEAFKTIYARENIENAFYEKGFHLDELINEFKKSLCD